MFTIPNVFGVVFSCSRFHSLMLTFHIPSSKWNEFFFPRSKNVCGIHTHRLKERKRDSFQLLCILFQFLNCITSIQIDTTLYCNGGTWAHVLHCCNGADFLLKFLTNKYSVIFALIELNRAILQGIQMNTCYIFIPSIEIVRYAQPSIPND